MSEETGKRIADYEILGTLGSGGMGRVFKVRNVISDRVEALKVLLPDLSGRQDLADRFLREIKIVAALNHPNIAAFRTALTVGNQLVMVMEYIEGNTLAARLEQGRIPVADALSYVDQVLNALNYAHGQNVIHRDIKPANMMLTPEGVIKLMDFGIARSGLERRLTVTGTAIGSLCYMSPEQVQGTCCDPRSDLYSVGVSLYEMITGEQPFRADSPYSVMAAQVQQPPKPPMELRADIPSALNEIILIAMAKKPEDRFQSAEAFRNTVNSVRQGLPPLHPALLAETTPNNSLAATVLLHDTAPVALVSGTSSISLKPSLVAPPPVQPQASQFPATGEVLREPSEHRGLYMTIGALIVLSILLAAGFYVPRRIKTNASTWADTNHLENAGAAQASQNEQMQPSDIQQASSITSDPPAGSASKARTSDSADMNNLSQHTDSVVSPPSVAASSSKAATDSMLQVSGSSYRQTRRKSGIALVEKPTAVGSTAVTSLNSGNGFSTGHESQSVETQAAEPQKIENRTADPWEEIEHEADQLSSSAGSINESLDNLRRQQSARGLALRGDVSAAEAMMNANIAKVQLALQDHDADEARRYLDLAQAEIGKLRKFLGH